jgi:integrase
VALKARLKGHRAEDCNYAVWLKYARERQEEAAADTVHLELSVARSAYKLAQRNGVVSRVPDFPTIKLRVRQGFVEPGQWAQLRAKLRPDFRDAGDFAFLCGAREMETLTLKWADVERDARVIHLRVTKSGRPRAIPYAEYPELAALIERRAAVAEQLKRAAVITPWVFCFSAPVIVRGRQYHAAGGELFKATGQRGLPVLLRSEWAAACAGAGLPGLLFHDLRRSAARNFERAGVPRSVAMTFGGWSDKIYSRYAIGAERELAAAGASLSGYLRRAGWHSVDSGRKNPRGFKGILAEGGRSRTFRRTQCPPSRF